MALNPPAPDPVALAEMERFEATGELIPGAARKLAGAAAAAGANGRAPLHVRAEAAAKVFASPIGQSYRNPDYSPPKGMDNPLRRVLTRYADMLAGSATIEKLVNMWGADFIRGPMGPTMGRGPTTPGGFQDESRITRTVMERLSRRENAVHLRTAPAPRAGEERLGNILGQHFAGEIDIAKASADWARDFHGQPDHVVVSQVARRLALAPVATKYAVGGQPLASDDPRINTPAPRVEGRDRTRSGPLANF